MIYFAWDNPNESLMPKFELFKKHTSIKSDRNKVVYVLTNFNSTHEQDLYRVYTLRDTGFSPYVMVYDKQNAPKITRRLQRYVNCRWIFRNINSFDEYIA